MSDNFIVYLTPVVKRLYAEIAGFIGYATRNKTGITQQRYRNKDGGLWSAV